MQITTYKAPETAAATVTAARSNRELVERIAEATASVADIRLFLSKHTAPISPKDTAVIQYAIARARYREGMSLTLEQLATLCETTVERVKHYVKQVGLAVENTISCNGASTVMCRMYQE